MEEEREISGLFMGFEQYPKNGNKGKGLPHIHNMSSMVRYWLIIFFCWLNKSWSEFRDTLELKIGLGKTEYMNILENQYG